MDNYDLIDMISVGGSRSYIFTRRIAYDTLIQDTYTIRDTLHTKHNETQRDHTRHFLQDTYMRQREIWCYHRTNTLLC